MQNNTISQLRILFAVSDLLLINACFFITAHIIQKQYFDIHTVWGIKEIIFYNISWLFGAFLFRLYENYTIFKLRDVQTATWRCIGLTVIAFSTYVYLTKGSAGFQGYFVILFYLLLIFGFIISRFAYKALESLLSAGLKDRKACVLAVASIGGHWIELMRFMPLFEENEVTFISTKPFVAETVKGYNYHSVPDGNRKEMLNLLKCILYVMWFTLRVRPQVIITTGAAPGLISIFIGRLYGAKTIWIDSIANVEQLSLSGKIASLLADRVYTQWQHLASPKVIFSGNVF